MAKVWVNQYACLFKGCPNYGMVRQQYGVVKDGMIVTHPAVCAGCKLEMMIVEPISLAEAFEDWLQKQELEVQQRRFSAKVGATFVVEEEAKGKWTTPASTAAGEKTDPTLVYDDGSQNDTRLNTPIESHWPQDPACVYYKEGKSTSTGIRCGTCAAYWREHETDPPF